MSRASCCLAACLLFAAWPSSLAQTGRQTAKQTDNGWPTYGGDPGGQRFSSATQVNASNVAALTVAWTYHTHALDSARGGHRSASFESTPILFRGALYLSTPFDEVIALDPATGAQRWRYDPQLPAMGEGNLITSRGVAAWDGRGQGLCSTRLFLGTLDARLIAIDAATGSPCLDFGTGGAVSLKQGVGYKPGDVYVVTSAPTVLGDVVVVGSSIPDNQYVEAEMGTVRGFDVRTGRQLWAWDPIPWALGRSPRTGGGNAWSTIAADPKLGLVYIPTGSASPDYYGGLRAGDNRDADSVVALDAKTGQKRWAFQVVHHNLWDYDVAAEPLLFTWRGSTPAVAINTKMGQVFVLDRRTGTPLFPVAERPVPQSDVPGESASPTQPISSLPAVGPLTLQEGGPGWQRDTRNAQFCSQQIAALRYDGLYTPPSLRGSVQFPGPLGGVNWGSAAFDPASGVMYVNNNRYAYAVWLVPRSQPLYAPVKPTLPQRLDPLYALPFTSRRKPQLLLAALLLILGCAVRRSWFPGIPFLVPSLFLLAFAALTSYHFKIAKAEAYAIETASVNAPFGDDHSANRGAPYALHRKPILDYDGHPCTKTPWGALTAIDLNAGRKLWESTEGTLVAGQTTGSIGLAGPMVAAGGLVFTAATKEPLLRAFDAATGKQLWQGALPVPAQATPMSYQIGGRQYIVIAAGGHGTFGTAQGDSLIAFALP